MDLNEVLGDSESAFAYAATYVFSDCRRNAVLRLDSNDHNRAWLNDRLVSFLKNHGIQTVGEKGLNTECPAFLPPERSKQLAREVATIWP